MLLMVSKYVSAPADATLYDVYNSSACACKGYPLVQDEWGSQRETQNSIGHKLSVGLFHIIPKAVTALHRATTELHLHLPRVREQ